MATSVILSNADKSASVVRHPSSRGHAYSSIQSFSNAKYRCFSLRSARRATALPSLSSREISYFPSKTTLHYENSGVIVEANSMTEVLGTLKNVVHQLFRLQ